MRHCSAFSVLVLFLVFTIVSVACASTAPVSDSATPESAPHIITVPKAAILGIVEGITEYLPVSSTGHLIIVGDLMGLVHYSDQAGPFGKLLDKNKMEAINSFDIVIQFGAILAVVGLYRNRVGQMLEGIAGRNRDGLKLLTLLIIAFLPAAIVGLPFHKKIEAYFFGPVPVAWALIVGGIAMIAIEFFYERNRSVQRTKDLNDITYNQALIIGIAQVLAMWPGTSRSMITIVAALLVGLDMLTAAEFSFLLGLPTLTGATVISAHEDWHVLKQVAGIDGMLVGLILSGVVAALAIKAFVKWLTHHGLTPFGIYRIIAAIFVFWLLAA